MVQGSHEVSRKTIAKSSYSYLTRLLAHQIVQHGYTVGSHNTNVRTLAFHNVPIS